MVSDEFLTQALTDLREAMAAVREGQEANRLNWQEMPRLLDRSAANFAIKANSAATDAVSPVKDLLEQQGHVLKGLRADMAELTRESSFLTRDLKALKKDLGELKKQVVAAEARISKLEDRGPPP
jgi:septal ring factor EnvC (AmiA/AmiB activator)